MMKRRLHTVYISCLIFVLISCNGQLAGGGTETTNGISGTVSCYSAIPATNNGIVAAIYSVNYRPDSAIGIAETTIVGNEGGFQFNPQGDNRYNLFVWDTVNYMAAYFPQVPADTSLGLIRLDNTGILITTRPSPAAGVSPYEQYKLVIPGSPYYIKGESNSTLILPQGDFEIELGLLPKDSPGDNPVWVNQQKNVVINPIQKDTTWLEIP
jgi:hypothetical protein